ncbi:MAG: GNAT family N-acetyltransferase [Promethearchaeota archaeon]
MPIISRKFNSEKDFEQVITFLLHTYKITNSLVNWLPDRFENSYYKWTGDIQVWEIVVEGRDLSTAEIIAIANPEYERVYYIQIHPDYKYLEREIVEWIEKHCIEKKTDKSKNENLHLFSLEGDQKREALLSELGYENRGIFDYIRTRPLDMPVPAVKVPEGFTIRSFQGRADYQKYMEAIKAVFNHDHVTEEVLDYLTSATFYNQDLDIVALAPNGTIAAFCTIRMDPVGKTASLEPMGTHPGYRKLGLARAVLYEGLKRAKKYVPTLFYIGGAANTPEANKFYEAVGFSEKVAEYVWRKEI